MPLARYGVLLGTLHRVYRDQPDRQGRWYHVNLEVDAPTGRYRAAVDVDSKQSTVGVAWKVLVASAGEVQPVPTFPPGYHELARNDASGALDYLRHVAFVVRPGCIFARSPDGWLANLLASLSRRRAWRFGSNLDAAAAFEPMLVPGRRTWAFGEPFTSGLGMHNVHQNQGDPAGSQWWDENGTWQDGATMTERPDGRFDVFLSKFSTQSDRTDDAGHPA